MTPETTAPRFVVFTRSTGPFGTLPAELRPVLTTFSRTVAEREAQGFRLINVPATVQEVR
jgi:hypothetical protein